MEKIVSTAVVKESNPIGFCSSLNEVIFNFQDEELDVEVQYFNCITEREDVYSALIVGRKKSNG